MVPYLAGISGGSGCGKKQICEIITNAALSKVPRIERNELVVLSMNMFYRENLKESLRAKYFNLDHPDAFDDDLLYDTLFTLKNGAPVTCYRYDIKECVRKESFTIDGSKVKLVLLEGLLTLYYPRVRDLLDLKIFIDVDAEERLTSRIINDTRVLNRDTNDVIDNYLKYVKPCFESFCLPCKKYATVIVPRGLKNCLAIDLIAADIVDSISSHSNIAVDSYSKVSKTESDISINSC